MGSSSRTRVGSTTCSGIPPVVAGERGSRTRSPERSVNSGSPAPGRRRSSFRTSTSPTRPTSGWRCSRDSSTRTVDRSRNGDAAAGSSTRPPLLDSAMTSCSWSARWAASRTRGRRPAAGRTPGRAKGRAVGYRSDAFVLDIRLPAGIEPFRLTRKRWTYRAFGGGGRPMRFVDRIEPAGEEDTICIQVVAADSLYVTDDFLVTHNTLNDAFIILDEAQNTTPEQMKMFLTRIGFGSKAVVNGDVDADRPAERADVGARRRAGDPGGHRGHRVLRTSARGTWSATRSCRTSSRRTVASGSSATRPPTVRDDHERRRRQPSGDPDLQPAGPIAVDEEGLTSLAREILAGEGSARGRRAVRVVRRRGPRWPTSTCGSWTRTGPTDVLSFPLDEVDDARRAVARRRDHRAVGRGDEQPGRSRPGRFACSWCTASSTCSATTMKRTRSAQRCGRDRSATAGCGSRERYGLVRARRRPPADLGGRYPGRGRGLDHEDQPCACLPPPGGWSPRRRVPL